MFLVDSALAASDWDGIVSEVKRILDRAGAEIISIRKWDERQLAYAVKGKTRGTYVLSYFRVEGPRVSEIERDIRLSEIIVRSMILCGEHLTAEEMEKETPAMITEREGFKRPTEPAVPAEPAVEDEVDAEKVVVDALDFEVTEEDDKKKKPSES